MELIISEAKKCFEGVDGEPHFKIAVPELRLKLGEMVYLLGHNGSGKTVYLRLLSGEIPSDDSPVKLHLNNRSWNPPNGISIVRQKAEDNLALDLTVKENILLRLMPKDFLNWFFPDRRNELVHTLLYGHNELLKKYEQPVKNLSTGQKQTLACLGAMAGKNGLLLLDEFLSATDQRTSSILRGIVKDFVINTPACTIIVSHDIQLALNDADRILILKAGELTHDFKRDSPDWGQRQLERLLT